MTRDIPADAFRVLEGLWSLAGCEVGALERVTQAGVPQGHIAQVLGHSTL